MSHGGSVLKKSCKSYFKTNDQNKVVSEFIEYNHEVENEDSLNRQIVSNEVKRKALNDLCKKPFKLICTQLKKGPINITPPDM